MRTAGRPISRTPYEVHIFHNPPGWEDTYVIHAWSRGDQVLVKYWPKGPDPYYGEGEAFYVGKFPLEGAFLGRALPVQNEGPISSKEVLQEVSKCAPMGWSSKKGLNPSRIVQMHFAGAGLHTSGVPSPMTKKQVQKILYGIYEKHMRGFFQDETWAPIQKLRKEASEAGLDLILIDAVYQTAGGRPVSKTWRYEVPCVSPTGKGTTLYVRVVASGAGSVEAPLDRYDLVLTTG